MNVKLGSNSPRMALLDSPLVFWAAVALLLFGAYLGLTRFLEPNAALREGAGAVEANALGRGAPAQRCDWRERAAAAHSVVDASAGFGDRSGWRSPARSASEKASEAQSLLLELLQGSAEAEDFSAVINGYLRELVALGPAAVPAIKEFLAAGEDVKFGRLTGGKGVDYPSLRVGLIEALGEIGGREAIEALVETLTATAEPLEIAALARALEWQAPGVYRQELLTAARESVEVASLRLSETRGKPGSQRAALDVSPLFEVMRAFGNTDLLGEMLREADQSMPPWKVYSMIALSQLPNAEGVEVLRDALVTDEGLLARQNLFGLQMLAQSAAERPAAAEALVELAMVHGQEIPASDWRKLAWTLRGHSYDFGGALKANGGAAANGKIGMEVNMHSLNLHLRREASDPATWPAQQVERQITLIDQLLATEPPEEAALGLERARDWILRRSGQAVTRQSI